LHDTYVVEQDGVRGEVKRCQNPFRGAWRAGAFLALASAASPLIAPHRR
jgi:hypothetical protein